MQSSLLSLSIRYAPGGREGTSEPAEKMKACKAYALESSSITPATEHGINFLTAWMTVAAMARSFH